MENTNTEDIHNQQYILTKKPLKSQINPINDKSNIFLNVLSFLIVLAIFCLIFALCISIFMIIISNIIFVPRLKDVKDIICKIDPTSESNLNNFYKHKVTEDFKEVFSLQEFKRYIRSHKSVFEKCNEKLDKFILNPIELILPSSISVQHKSGNYNNYDAYIVQYPTEEYIVEITIIKLVENKDYLLNNIKFINK